MKRSKTIQRTQRRQDKASDRKKYRDDTGKDKLSRYATKRRGQRHD